MDELNYIFGPVPSRRLGSSLGISPIPKKTCNYSCVYCQLGRTDKMTNLRKEYFPLDDILREFDAYHSGDDKYDVVTIAGEGEPTLYSRLGELIAGLKKRTLKPVAVITNGALLYDGNVRQELMAADIALPSLDSVNEEMFRRINRGIGSLKFGEIFEGLKIFSHEYSGKLYIELMLMDRVNDDEISIAAFKNMLKELKYDRLYINTPLRPPAESGIKASSPEAIKRAADELHGIAIDVLAEGGFSSDISDDYKAVLSIIRRHPMNRLEIEGFLTSRGNVDIEALIKRLKENPDVETNKYKGNYTYRLK